MTPTLHSVRECELHEPSLIDCDDYAVTGMWIKTDTMTQKTYISMDKMRIALLLDDVNPVSYDDDEDDMMIDEWCLVDHEDENDEVMDHNEIENVIKVRESEIEKQKEEMMRIREEHRCAMDEIERLKALNLNQQQQNESLSLQMKRKKEEMAKLSRELEVKSTSPSMEQVAAEQKRYIFCHFVSFSHFHFIFEVKTFEAKCWRLILS